MQLGLFECRKYEIKCMFSSKNLKGSRGDADVHGNMLLRGMVKWWPQCLGPNLSDVRRGLVVGFCDHGNENLGSMYLVFLGGGALKILSHSQNKPLITELI